MSPREALDLVFLDPDSDQEMSIRDYFKAMLSTLFDEGESFSGKRPFGNSGWERNLETPLVMAGVISGNYEVINEDDEVWVEVTGVNTREYQSFIQLMIAEL